MNFGRDLSQKSWISTKISTKIHELLRNLSRKFLSSKQCFFFLLLDLLLIFMSFLQSFFLWYSFLYNTFFSLFVKPNTKFLGYECFSNHEICGSKSPTPVVFKKNNNKLFEIIILKVLIKNFFLKTYHFFFKKKKIL